MTSKNGNNISSNVVSCKPLCCLKDEQGNIIAQDYIDYTRQKIVRQCNYMILNGTENWTKSSSTVNDIFVLSDKFSNLNLYNREKSLCNIASYNQNIDLINKFYFADNKAIAFVFSNYNTNTLEQFKSYLASNNVIIIYQLENALEEDIDCTSSLVQYEDKTEIYNTDNAEIEVEITNNKAISSTNESIIALQKKDNKLKKETEWIKLNENYETYYRKINRNVEINVNIYNSKGLNLEGFKETAIGNLTSEFRPSRDITVPVFTRTTERCFYKSTKVNR